MTFSRWLCILTLGAITGCAFQSRESEPKNAFLLDISDMPDAQMDLPVSVQIHPCRAHPPLAGTPMVYRLSRVRYERDSFNIFMVSPTEQIDALLDQRLSGGRSLEAHARASMREWTLQPTLEQLWGDFTDPNQARAEVQMHFLITELSPRTRSRQVILDARFRSTQDLRPEPNAEDLVTQLSASLADVFAQLEATLKNRIEAMDTPAGSSP